MKILAIICCFSFVNSQYFMEFVRDSSKYFSKTEILIISDNLEEFQSRFNDFVNIEIFATFASSKDLSLALNRTREQNIALFVDDIDNFENLWNHYQYWQTWFVPNTTMIPTGINLRFDSQLYQYQYVENENVFNVKEIFALRNEIQIQHVGFWNASSNEFHMKMPNIYERRSDLNGITLKVVTIHFKKFAELTLDTNGDIISGTGEALEIMALLEKELNFTMKLIHSRDGKWGSEESDGSWNGMVSMLMDGEADICASALSATLERSRVIDFAIPYDKDIDTLMIMVNQPH